MIKEKKIHWWHKPLRHMLNSCGFLFLSSFLASEGIKEDTTSALTPSASCPSTLKSLETLRPLCTITADLNNQKLVLGLLPHKTREVPSGLSPGEGPVSILGPLFPSEGSCLWQLPFFCSHNSFNRRAGFIIFQLYKQITWSSMH